jgi:hypothetical protein
MIRKLTLFLKEILLSGSKYLLIIKDKNNHILYRIGTEERNIFGIEIKSKVSPGPASYNSSNAYNFVSR